MTHELMLLRSIAESLLKDDKCRTIVVSFLGIMADIHAEKVSENSINFYRKNLLRVLQNQAYSKR